MLCSDLLTLFCMFLSDLSPAQGWELNWFSNLNCSDFWRSDGRMRRFQMLCLEKSCISYSTSISISELIETFNQLEKLTLSRIKRRNIFISRLHSPNSMSVSRTQRKIGRQSLHCVYCIALLSHCIACIALSCYREESERCRGVKRFRELKTVKIISSFSF